MEYLRRWFNFRLSGGWGPTIDTFDGTITKDCIGGCRTIPLRLTEFELATIFRKAIAEHVFDVPEPHPPYADSHGWGVMKPNRDIDFVIVAGGAKRHFTWNTGHLAGDSEQWKSLNELVQLIVHIVETRPEYKALPPEQGGYM